MNQPFIELPVVPWVLNSMRRVILFLLLTCPLPALAGDSAWCLVIDGIEQCKYATAEKCYESRASLRGSCRMNYKSLGAAGDMRYCLITANSRDCTYNGKAACLGAARSVKGGCVENVNKYMDAARSKRARFDDLGIQGEFEDLQRAQRQEERR
jgi:hypothetical protein